ncbi:hypothetical protein U1Q18_044146 [Sarracenia purpurea var. burkii]
MKNRNINPKKKSPANPKSKSSPKPPSPSSGKIPHGGEVRAATRLRRRLRQEQRRRQRRDERDGSKQAGALRKEEAVRAGGFLAGFGGDAGKDAIPSASKEFDSTWDLSVRKEGV